MPPQFPTQSKMPKVDPQLSASLMALLNLMKNKAEKENLKPVIKTRKLIDLLKTSGVTINYHQLRELTNDKTIGPLIKDINKDQTTLRLDSDEDDDFNQDMPGVQQDDSNEEDLELPSDENQVADYSGDDNSESEDDQEDYDLGKTGHSGKSIISGMAKRALARS